jgi:hypothetical protein
MSASKIPLKPFIQIPLSATLGARSSERAEISSDDGDSGGPDPDDIDPDDLILHPIPILLTLAAMLMELYSATPFEVLASRYDVKGTVSRTNPMDVNLVFNGFKNDMLQNSKFIYAIEKCLNPSTWEDESSQVLDDQTLRVMLYEEVVRPLEDELCDAFQAISIDDLDKIAETVDFRSWGSQTIHTQQGSRSAEAIGPRAAAAAVQPRYLQPTNDDKQLGVPLQPSFVEARSLSLGVSTRPWTRPKAFETDYLTGRFFDEEEVPKSDRG